MSNDCRKPTEEEVERAWDYFRAPKNSNDGGPSLSDDEAMAIALEVVAEVRGERRAEEERQRSKLDLPKWNLGVKEPLTRREACEDVLLPKDDLTQKP